jgi:hypothetical protein
LKTLITAVALATLIAAPALAQTRERPGANSNWPQAGQGGQYGARAPGPVMKGGQVIAHDPDPWIRNEILRHSDSGWPD